MISCLCVTRGDRPGFLSQAVADFVRQTFPDRELVILHDGDDAVDARVRAIVSPHAGAPIRVERTAPGPKLGGLRNIAIARARGEWICQWDDDDRHHPARLRLQWERAQSEGAAVNYLVDQLHLFEPENILFWDDWNAEPYPLNIIQGTILARRSVLPPYPDIGPGEDSCKPMRCFARRPRKRFAFRASATWDGAIFTGFTGPTPGTRNIIARFPPSSTCLRPAWRRVLPCCGSSSRITAPGCPAYEPRSGPGPNL